MCCAPRGEKSEQARVSYTAYALKVKRRLGKASDSWMPALAASLPTLDRSARRARRSTLSPAPLPSPCPSQCPSPCPPSHAPGSHRTRVGARVVGVGAGVAWRVEVVVVVGVGVVGVVARSVSGEKGKRSVERAEVRAEEAPALPPAASRARGCRQSGERGEGASAPPGLMTPGSTGARGGFLGSSLPPSPRGGFPSAEVTPRSRSRLPEHMGRSRSRLPETTGRSMASRSTSDEI